MKKLFIGALALTMFTACSQDEIVEQQQLSSAITFDGAFVNNATRAAEDPSTTENSIEAFQVWASIADKDVNDEVKGNVFDAQEVTKTGTEWTYSPLQYWIPGNTYYFAAISPIADGKEITVTAANEGLLEKGLGTVKFVNKDGKKDFLYDAQTVAPAQQGNKVKFNFNHMLAKVKFSFTNGFANANNKIIVKNIKMTVPGDATIDLTASGYENGWKLGKTETVLSFGNMDGGKQLLPGYGKVECDNERLTIPATDKQEYLVTFDVILYSGDVVALENTLSTTITGAALEMGKAYNFHATLDQNNINENPLKPIEFDAPTVKDWGEVIDYNGDMTDPEDNRINTKVISVASETELLAALSGVSIYSRNATEDEDINIKLTDNIALSKGALVIEKKKVNIDLSGMTLTAANKFAENSNNTNYSIVFYVGKDAELTINGEGTVNTQQCVYNIPVWAHDGGIVNIYGGTYENEPEADGTGSDLIYAQSGSEINIYGGTFKACENQKPGVNSTMEKYSALNLYGQDPGSIKVYGGEFYGFDPANNLSENPAVPFMAEGYISKLTSTENNINVYTVYPEATLQKVSNQAELQNALNAGGTNIVLDADIVTTSTLFVNEKVSAVLNLNGHNIINNSNSTVLEEGDGIIVYGKLEINGQGTVQGNTRAVWARSTTGAEVTINGGNYIGAVGGACEVIYASGNGKITINGGTFEAKTEDKTSFAKPQFAVLNLHANGKDGAHIYVYGGKFKNFDPANNVSENPVTVGNFVAQDYKSYAVDANWFAVVKN